MKVSEYRKQAKECIQDLFKAVLDSEDKDVWKKAFDFINRKIDSLERGERWEQMFVWRYVRSQMSEKFGAKFIRK